MSVEISETRDIATCLSLRRAVFIDEQGISEADEFDDLDDGAVHLLAKDGSTPVATARLIRVGETMKIGRVCVLRPARGTGLGKRLMITALDMARKDEAITRAYVSAQTYALAFYEDLGFKAYGDIYDDAGIPHQDMERTV